MWLNTTNLDTYSQHLNTKKTDMKSTSVCGSTYHCGPTESALCAHRAQMWGSSAEAHAHSKYFYRTAVWLSCSVKSLLNIDFVFTVFLTERRSPLPGLMVHLMPHWAGDSGITFRLFYILRWSEPPKSHSWHRILGINAVGFTYFHILMILKHRRLVWNETAETKSWTIMT